MALRDEWWFGTLNHLESATLAAADSFADTPPASLYDYRAETLWRVSTSTMTLQTDHQSAKLFEVFLIRLPVATDLSQPFQAGDVATIRFSDVQSGDDELGVWTVALDSQNLNTGCIVALYETGITARYVSVEIPRDVDIDYMFLGPSFLPEKTYSRGALIDVDDQSVAELSLFGSVNVTPGPKTDIFDAPFQVWSAADFTLWRDFVRRIGVIRPFVFGYSQTTNLADSYVAHLTAVPSFRVNGSIYQARLSLEAFR